MPTLEERVAALELKESKKKSSKGYRTGKRPLGFISPQEFYDKYEFISDAYVRKMLKGNSDFFTGFYTSNTSHLYLDPLRICEFFERKMSESVRANNQYEKRQIHNKDLKLLVDKIRKKIQQPPRDVPTLFEYRKPLEM